MKEVKSRIKISWPHPGIFLFLSTFLPGIPPVLTAQPPVRLSGKSVFQLKQEDLNSSALFICSPSNTRSPRRSIIYPERRPIAGLFTPSKAPLVYSYQSLSFFCKVDVQLERAIRFPVKIRLGEVQYVESMEYNKKQ